MCWRRSSRFRSVVMLSLKFSCSLIIHMLLLFKNSTLSIFMLKTAGKVGPISCSTTHLLAKEKLCLGWRKLSGKFN